METRALARPSPQHSGELVPAASGSPYGKGPQGKDFRSLRSTHALCLFGKYSNSKARAGKLSPWESTLGEYLRSSETTQRWLQSDDFPVRTNKSRSCFHSLQDHLWFQVSSGWASLFPYILYIIRLNQPLFLHTNLRIMTAGTFCFVSCFCWQTQIAGGRSFLVFSGDRL